MEEKGRKKGREEGREEEGMERREKGREKGTSKVKILEREAKSLRSTGEREAEARRASN